MTSAQNCARRNCKRNLKAGNRIQKLLLSEYSEFSEMVLVEAPFAETTRNGRGLRQVTLGLTPTRLIVAADIIKKNSDFFCPANLDPSIESFELVSIYPLQYVTLSVFRRRKRRTLKARFVTGTVKYYELGGSRRKVLWEIWREHAKSSLVRKINGSSLSETTAASSSSSSTLYLFPSDVDVEKGVGGKGETYRIWARYGTKNRVPPMWTERDLYLGPAFDELKHGQYAPVPIRFAGASLEDLKYELEDHSPCNVNARRPCGSWPACQTQRISRAPRCEMCKVLYARENVCRDDRSVDACNCNSENYSVENQNTETFREVADKKLRKQSGKQSRKKSLLTLAPKISRFGFGVPEKCASTLVLSPYKERSDKIPFNFREVAENSVAMWERARARKPKERHLRKYGLSTAPHFLRSLGPWAVQPGERDSIQMRRSSSAVAIRRQPADLELRLPVSRRQLSSSVSCTALEPGRFGASGTTTKGKLILFWTPEYWYRPRAAAVAYRELRRHLDRLRDFREQRDHQTRRKLFHGLSFHSDIKEAVEEKSSSFLGRIFHGNGNSKKQKEHERTECNGIAYLRRLLRMDLRITVWDLTSTTLAAQLTLIDRDLFARIPTAEIEILVFQGSVRNAPNFGAWIAFGHRISCLTASEVLAVKKLEMRARIIARFINAAEKCIAMGNFHSCRSILAGLQSPAIYRLRSSWSYLRTHHATKYETMEGLCKIYKNLYGVSYQKAWTKAERNPPCLPYVGDILLRILGLKHSEEILYFYKKDPTLKRINNFTTSVTTNDQDLIERKTGFSRRILAVFGIRCKKCDNPVEQDKDSFWTYRQQNLARKFFYRWNGIVVASKIRAEHERKLKEMDSKRKRVLNLASWLADCRRLAEGYDFPRRSVAWEFLLKARYREDRENFFISLKLEPPKNR